jgi:hypothetical protein
MEKRQDYFVAALVPGIILTTNPRFSGGKVDRLDDRSRLIFKEALYPFFSWERDRYRSTKRCRFVACCSMNATQTARTSSPSSVVV